MVTAGVILAALAAALGFGVRLYNRLVRLRNTAESAWSDIDVHLKKRHDLVPNLVAAVTGYAGHEQTVLARVTDARARAAHAQNPAESARAETALGEGLRQLLAVAEAYPELKANRNFLELQAQLKEIEDGIEAARRYYNAVVRDYNTTVEQFPSNLVAAGFRFGRREFFELEAPAEEKKPVRVGF
jgi:LemA protein